MCKPAIRFECLASYGTKKQLLAGIDVGTTKICSVCAGVEDGKLEVLGTGWAPSRGLKKGVVVNLSETIDSVKASLEEAGKTGASGGSVRLCECRRRLYPGKSTAPERPSRFHNKDGEITGEDINRAVSAATSLDLGEDYQVIHRLTRDFNVDGLEGVIDPLGLNGHHLSVSMHLVLNASAVVQNIVNAVNKAGVLVDGVVMQQLASSEAVLSSDEKELGTILVDIGGGTTDVAVYNRGSICHSEVLPIGGDLVTKDIAIGIRAPLQEAEELKRSAGSVFPESVPAEELIEVTEVGSGVEERSRGDACARSYGLAAMRFSRPLKERSSRLAWIRNW